jgi:PAS domain S-box-containing protein
MNSNEEPNNIGERRVRSKKASVTVVGKEAGNRIVKGARSDTKGKKTLQSFLGMNKQLQILVQTIPDIIYFKDVEGRNLIVNKAFEKLVGLKREEIIGKTDEELLPPDLAKQCQKSNEETLKKGKLLRFEEQMIDEQGQTWFFETIKSPMRNENGKIIGLVGVSRNITHQKKSELAYEENKLIFNKFLNLTVDPIVIVDRRGKILEISANVKDITGYAREELVGKNFLRTKVLPAKSKAIILKNLFRRLRGKEVPPYEVEVLAKDESKRYAEVKALRITYAGEPAVMAVFHDITEHKKVEEALAYERDLLHALMDNVPDAIYFKDAESRFTRINREHARWLGLKDPKDALGKTDFDFYTKEHARDAYADEQEIVKTGQPLVNKVEKTERPDGYNIWNSTTKVPIKRENGHVIGIVGISRDITDLRNTEDALRKSEEALRETNRLLRHSNVDLENYTYVVSHDLKAPLRAIKAFSTFLVEDYGDELNENAREYLQRITKAVSNMDALIEDLLLLSRVGRKFMEEEKVDLNCLLGEIVIDLEPVINKRNGTVKYSDLPKMQVPRIWMKQMFMNLIDNGMKYNKSENPVVEVSFEDKGEEYLFRVKDNGIGIDKKYYERIFNLFERLHTQDEYEGTGAGLAICRKIAEHLGGKIWVESEVGKGSVFYFALPKKISSVKEDHKE